jgi:transporter family protein
MVRWQLPATITLLIWGLWAFLPKLALRAFDPRSVLVWESLGSVLVGLGVLVSTGFRVQTTPVGVLAAVVAGVCGLGGALLFLVALERGKASVVVPFTSLYPLVTLVLSVLFLGERPSAANLLGVFFAMVAVVLLSLGGD